MSILASIDTYALTFVLPAHIESRGISVNNPPEETICPRRHMFSCGGSIFDYEKRGGGRERKRTRETTTTKKTEQAPNRPPTRQSIGSTYITCVYCTRELNNCIFYTISFHRISHTGNKSPLTNLISYFLTNTMPSLPPGSSSSTVVSAKYINK